MVQVRDIRTESKALTIGENSTIGAAWKQIESSNQSELIVVDNNNKPQKILTVIDIAGAPRDMSIDKLTNKLADVNVVMDTDNIDKVTSDITDRPFTVVMDRNQHPVGLIKPTDLANYWMQQI
jgi:predicted transcriptional regulator